MRVTVTPQEILPSATTKNTGPDLYLFLAGLPRAIFSRATAAEFAGRSSCRARQPKIVFIFLAGISCDNACAGRALSLPCQSNLAGHRPQLPLHYYRRTHSFIQILDGYVHIF